MTIKKFLTKTLAVATTGMLLMTSVANAATPNSASAPNELSSMQTAGRAIGLTETEITNLATQCIDGQKIINAINAANSALTEIRKLAYRDAQNDPFPNESGEKLWGYDIAAYVKEDADGTIDKINSLLSKASLGSALNLSLVPLRTNNAIPSGFDKYFTRLILFLNGNRPENERVQLVDFDAPDTPNPLDDPNVYFTNYMDFLAYLYNYYNVAGCYKTSTAPLPDPTPGRPIQTPQVPVIVNVTNINQFVYVGTFKTPSTVDPKAKKDKKVKNAVIYAENKTLKAGDKFVFMQGVTAKDNAGKGKDLSKKVSIDGTINTYVPGKYVMTYKVTGANGVEVKKQVTITVTARPRIGSGRR